MLPEYLYNITFDVEDTRTVLEPSIPESAADDEDKTIPRVCLSSSVESCVRAVATNKRSLYRGSTLIVRSVNTSTLDKCYLWTPDRLFIDNRVPDALETQEYWYCNTVQVDRKIYTVEDFDHEHVINWTCLQTEQVQNIATKYCDISAHTFQSAFDIYQYVTRYLETDRKYEESDDFYEEIVELPWAQGIRISNLRLKEVAYE